MKRTRCRSVLIAALGLLVASGEVAAGPPFFTDDPQPFDFRHWEFYLSATRVTDSGDRAGDAPHFEANYGMAPDLQLHLIFPLAYSRPADEATTFGLGDVEVGAKYRFVKETDGRPQVGAFPLVELPSADASRAFHGCGCSHLYVAYLLTLGPKP